jgi:AAA+ superfamily predicted ATPase
MPGSCRRQPCVEGAIVEEATVTAPFVSAVEHLAAELGLLDLRLERQVIRLRAARLLTEDDYRGLYIPHEQIDHLLDSRMAASAPPSTPPPAGIATLTASIIAQQCEIQTRAAAARIPEGDLPLVRLTQRLGLTRFEIDVLMTAVAPELELRYETLFAYVQNDVTRKRPTVDLAVSLSARGFDERCQLLGAFAPERALRREHLIALIDETPDRASSQPARGLKVDQRIVDFLLARRRLDERLSPYTERVDPVGRLDDIPLPDSLKARLCRVIQLGRGSDALWLFRGPHGVGQRAAAEALAAAAGRPLLAVDARLLAADGDFPLAAALLRREVLLEQAAVFLDHFELLLGPDDASRLRLATLSRELGACAGPLFVATEQPWHPSDPRLDNRLIAFDFGLPEYVLRRRLWERTLGVSGEEGTSTDTNVVAAKFVLTHDQIAAAAREAERLVEHGLGACDVITTDDVNAAARRHSGRELGRLADRLDPVHAWGDLVLPTRQTRQLRDVLASMQHRHVVHHEWGFDRRLHQGRGFGVLFAGPSGTGKTMAASILARELGLDLYRINLASVVSKYIGETEKNLDAIFREAEHSNAVLLFDEADALFGKRAEVRDAHDRYANIEVAYLLQRLERYAGMVILTTNLGKNIDEAFARRMQHTVEFPMPDAALRERIWRHVFPPEAPLAADVDISFLAARFEFSGGNIRNVALGSAFLAAESRTAITMRHVILATAREAQKIGRLPSQTDFQQYYDLIRVQPDAN